MAHKREIIVRGRQRTNLDPDTLAQLLVQISVDWNHPPDQPGESPDTFAADIEDRQDQAREHSA
jgi:hypothetical protein